MSYEFRKIVVGLLALSSLAGLLWIPAYPYIAGPFVSICLFGALFWGAYLTFSIPYSIREEEVRRSRRSPLTLFIGIIWFLSGLYILVGKYFIFFDKFNYFQKMPLFGFALSFAGIVLIAVYFIENRRKNHHE